MGDSIHSDMGDNVDSAVIGKNNRQRIDRGNTVNIDFELPTTEHERRQWQSRQIMELRIALIGDAEYGVRGLVDRVHTLRLWMYVIAVLMLIMLLITLWNVLQIQEIIKQLSELTYSS